MVFIRGPQPESVVWRHFRGEADGFSFAERDGVYEALVLANADRAVELFLALSEHLPPAVRVEIEDARGGTRWSGDDLALPDVRDAIARLKPALATYAGAEITIVSEDDQLTLTTNLEVFVYARTDRWLYLLQGKGVRRVRRLRARSWRLRRGEFAPSAEATQSLRLTAERLGITDGASAIGDPGDGGAA